MSDFLEAIVTMLPPEIGGRTNPVMPRDGSYRPFARIRHGGGLLRVRFIEGPPLLAPGDSDRVVLELESSSIDEQLLVTGVELELFEYDVSAVAVATVSRLCRDELAGAWPRSEVRN